MATFLTVPSSSLRLHSSLCALPSNSSSPTSQPVHSLLSTLSRRSRKCSRPVAKLDGDEGRGGCEFAFRFSDWGMAERLGGVACSLLAAASVVAWDLPAFAALHGPPDPVVTPYSKSAQPTQIGLVKGLIQACPLDINPNCVSTSSNNGGYAAPWIIPESSTSNAAKKIETAILSTQKNPIILNVEDTPDGGTYLVAEADGFLGRDVMEFLVKADVVTYRSMARKVVYFYPFTTPIGDFDGQQKRLKRLEDELGWSTPSFENTYYDQDYEEGY